MMASQGDILRDAGVDTVLTNADPDWREFALGVIASMGGHFTGEDIRILCRDAGFVPHHPNAWGAIIRIAIQRGLIEPTGGYRKPRSAASHSRKIQIYKRAGE